MTLQEMLINIPQLTPREQLVLMDALRRSLQKKVIPITIEQQRVREAVVDRLFGSLASDKAPLSDAELKEDYIDYLSKKYL
jgi:hypothetical protein